MTSATQEKETVVPAGQDKVQPESHEIDASARWPVAVLLLHGAFWLVAGSLLAVIASIKTHGPGFLGGVSFLTYGKVSAAANAALYYGFACQFALGIGLWLAARLSRCVFIFPGGGIVAALFWNAGVLLGVVGILAQGPSGYERLEMPLKVVPILLSGLIILGASLVGKMFFRTEKTLYPSSWFLFAAIFTFAWSLVAASLVVSNPAIRAVVKPAVALWYANSFQTLWLGGVALAVILYFVPKLSHQPLANSGLAIFAFWTYLIFGTAGGFQNMSGLPNWFGQTSHVAALLMLATAVAALILIWSKSWSPKKSKEPEDEWVKKLVALSFYAFVAGAALNFLLGTRGWSALLSFSLFGQGLSQLHLLGFVTLAFMAAAYHLLPRITGESWPKLALAKWHIRLSLGGIALILVGGLFGGWVHGQHMATPQMPFVEVARKIVPFIGLGTLGLLVFLAGQVLFLAHLAMLLFKTCASCCCAGRKEVA